MVCDLESPGAARQRAPARGQLSSLLGGRDVTGNMININNNDNNDNNNMLLCVYMCIHIYIYIYIYILLCAC